MRKVFVFMMILALCIGLLCGCGQTGSPAGSPTPDVSQTSSGSDQSSAKPVERTYGTLTVEDVNAGFLTFDQACLVDNIVYVKAGSNVTAETVRSEGEYGYIGPDAMVIFAYYMIEGDGIQVKDYTYEDFVAHEIPVYTGSVDGITEQLSRLGGNLLPVIITMEDYLILVIE